MRARVAGLDRQIADPSLWDDPRRAGSLTQEASRLRDELDGWERLDRTGRDARDLAALLDSEPDDAVEADLRSELDAMEKELAAREVAMLFTDPYSDHAALISVHAGAGGADSQDWAATLVRMYLRWAE